MIAESDIENIPKTDPSTDKSARSTASKQNLNPRRIKFSNTIQKFTNYFYRRQYFRQDALMRKWALVDIQQCKENNPKCEENVQNTCNTPKKSSTCKESVGKTPFGKSKKVLLLCCLF